VRRDIEARVGEGIGLGREEGEGGGQRGCERCAVGHFGAIAEEDHEELCEVGAGDFGEHVGFGETLQQRQAEPWSALRMKLSSTIRRKTTYHISKQQHPHPERLLVYSQLRLRPLDARP